MVKRVSALNALVNLKVVDAQLSSGDAGLCFEGGITLAFYNPFALVISLPGAEITWIGATVTAVHESDSEATICFNNGASLIVDLRDQAYIGPEAMQLRIPGSPIVIWN